MKQMAITATRIAFVIYDATRCHYEAAVEFFSPGLPVPLRVDVTYAAPQGLLHGALVKGLVRAAHRQILR
ncbi:MAG: hypothetical protein ACJASV_002776 [Pseudorhodobacter sp.]|jgi:hypothetical protein